jgi:hypothetical protein
MEGNATKHPRDLTAAPYSAVAEATILRKLLSKSDVIVSSNGVAVFVVTRAKELCKNTHVNKLMDSLFLLYDVHKNFCRYKN